MFCLNFVLATRWQWVEQLFGGLDKVYQAHALVGKAALTMILLHLAILVVQAIPETTLLTRYLLPGADIAYTLGLVSVVLLTALIVMTLWVKLKYEIWLKTHQYLGIPYILGGLHAIVLQTDWYMILLTLVGGYAWFYSLILYGRHAPQSNGNILQVTPRGAITEIVFQLNKPMRVQPGQFIFFSVRHSTSQIPEERHPFSISKIIDPYTFRISVKSLGDYTAQLTQLKPGDQITVFGPHGRFGQMRSKNAQVWVAGGIGITPFLSLLQAEASHPQPRPVHLIWAVKHVDEAIYHQEIQEYLQHASHVSYHLQQGRVSTHLLKQVIGERFSEDADVLMCGPVPMMHTLTAEWRKQGKPANKIFSEEFAMR